jgi:transposase-like protein
METGMNGNGTYPEALKTKVLSRLVGPHAVSATALSREVGISQGTLSRWLREAGTVAPVMVENKEKQQPTPERSRRRTQDWTPEEKLRVVLESMKLSDAELGAFLRREGLHEVQLREWHDAVIEAGREALGGGDRSTSKRRKKEAKRVRELEKELRRKEKALAEAAALIVLEKKLQTLWGGEDDDTDEESET